MVGSLRLAHPTAPVQVTDSIFKQPRQFSCSFVIASEAKQSIGVANRKLNCFVASLLAMTKDARPQRRVGASRPLRGAPRTRWCGHETLRLSAFRFLRFYLFFGFLRHCERSEAIQCSPQGLDCFVAVAPRNDESRRGRCAEPSGNAPSSGLLPARGEKECDGE